MLVAIELFFSLALLLAALLLAVEQCSDPRKDRQVDGSLGVYALKIFS